MEVAGSGEERASDAELDGMKGETDFIVVDVEGVEGLGVRGSCVGDGRSISIYGR